MYTENGLGKAKRGVLTTRRRFLYKSASFMLGSVFSSSFLSSALARERENPRSTFKPCIALIIDDIGHSKSKTRMFLDLNVPITYSVLPGLKRSRNISREINSRGFEIMMHQPMEPFNEHLDPGPGALYMKHKSMEIEKIVEKNIADIPFASGVNNHMGSRFTSCRDKTAAALKPIRKQGLYFIDSVTSHKSEAYRSARNFHMTTSRRDIFLDNNLDETAVWHQLIKLKKRAEKKGKAIGIGHPFHVTAKAVERFAQSLDNSDISLVPVSRILIA